MQKILRAVFLFLILSACSGAGSAATGTQPPGLVPYHTPTPTLTPTPLPPLTQVFIPTPTPVIYTVVNGDTMSGIAQRFKVSLVDLKTANPGVDPDAMPVGTVLLIPLGGGTTGEPSPTPAAVTVRQVRCLSESTGGLWCFGLVQNEQVSTLENLSALFTLLDASGSEVASQVAYGMLDILPAGASMPLAVHFPAPVPAEVTPRMQLLTSIMLQPGDTRYVSMTFRDVLVQMNASGRTARVSGQVMPNLLDGQINTLWILATAYDSAGNVVGVRRWESTEMLAGGVSRPFELSVYSLGPAIDRVDLLAEARP